ncbi:5-formyltetrahydrofolate cyclo-ligase [Paenibacillus macerans]|uniref:5-formyltetrahydrofolate cyclo-ligase n=1 Tax=Paenibacillus TaxID=44249 RepID=UPI000EDDCF38|nr:5-formyltetrahydrofolate cyclo-ligase [Paenibacillus macerans]MBS5914331.1 5-formyltetrahydrofolate cyclo-ligase [Paenibacillus macerans]MEC0136270.1 5-formyltetrahydrofolate cyclo-ligase [Paenibacillus macerans]GBK60881.1 5-formyltetrahydrofolate cyclo-ligase [Paenibacillus macerans]GBK67182.1 5-formyltetrahydrofolate cyclo-ligase [Paenibacillus macerans]
MELAEAKQELRRRMLQVRASIPEAARAEQSVAAAARAERDVLKPLRGQRGGRLNVMCYVSFRDEPDTRPLIRSCLAQSDRMLVPKIRGNRTLALHEISAEEVLLPGTWGIPEPGDETPVWPPARYPEIDLILVPGLAFDRGGGRIGFGAGYYDRLIGDLAERSGGTGRVVLAALALEELIVPGKVPMERHDFKLDLLFTAAGTIYMKESSDKLDELGIGPRHDSL